MVRREPRVAPMLFVASMTRPTYVMSECDLVMPGCDLVMSGCHTKGDLETPIKSIGAHAKFNGWHLVKDYAWLDNPEGGKGGASNPETGQVNADRHRQQREEVCLVNMRQVLGCGRYFRRG